PALAKRMMQYFSQMRPKATDTIFPELTEREREVLLLISQGKNNTEIADQLVISPKTVRNHITSVFDKLQVADRSQAILRARDAGLR
ncbi:MAG: response regulator transcription factor, partial [bacterium]